MRYFEKNFFSFLAFLLSAICLFSWQAEAKEVKADDMKATLDAPAGVEFTACTNAEKLSTYKNSNIGNEEWTGQGVITPTNGSYFLQMNGTGSKGNDIRSQRIKSSFSFTVAGAGKLSFDYRAATYGWNDDYLVFYEDDIYDTLVEEGGECWEEMYKEKEDGEVWYYYDVDVTDFWNSSYFNLYYDSYFHTVNVALLAPQTTDYEGPESEDNLDIVYKAWLDNFVWEPVEDALCQFQPASGSTFGGSGLTVSLNTDYSTVDFYYTTDGKTPSNSSTKYDDEEGITLTKDTVLKVAAYENGKLITNTLSASYTLRPGPAAPVCTVDAQEKDGDAHVSFSVPESQITFDYRYTLDGTAPTLDSTSGQSCDLSSACTLKVCAVDDGILGKVATFTVKNASAPKMQFYNGDTPVDNTLFDETGAFELTSTEEGQCYYTLGDNDPVAYETGKVEVDASTEVTYWLCVDYPQEGIADGGKVMLSSQKSAKELVQMELQDASWLSTQLVSDGWNLVGMTYLFTTDTGKKLAELFQAYGYNSEKKSLELVEELEPGCAYFIFGKGYEVPATLRCLKGTVESPCVRTNQWYLVSNQADFIYENGVYNKSDATDDKPGWKKATDEENSPEE